MLFFIFSVVRDVANLLCLYLCSHCVMSRWGRDGQNGWHGNRQVHASLPRYGPYPMPPRDPSLATLRLIRNYRYQMRRMRQATRDLDAKEVYPGEGNPLRRIPRQLRNEILELDVLPACDEAFLQARQALENDVATSPYPLRDGGLPSFMEHERDKIMLMGPRGGESRERKSK